MPRADFYLIAKPRFRDDPLRLVAELARKAYDADLWTLVLARDRAQAEALDDQLWDMGDEVFIPHQIAGAEADEDDEVCPVLIATPEFDPPGRPVVINLRDDAVPDGFERVLEVVPADPSAREPLRARWKQYKARGIEPNKYDM
ncbi:DNA polymerase III subunit chi [Luteimonas abyssi]|uniref:DNA polymerase III subunit chi n=1 Tax=Luteimonas abyssi TaxID=1247514 RepID=UPI000737C1B0|nr:DNA polymerase III subunit chi [Luteimonas abyssi]